MRDGEVSLADAASTLHDAIGSTSQSTKGYTFVETAKRFANALAHLCRKGPRKPSKPLSPALLKLLAHVFVQLSEVFAEPIA